MSLYLTDDVGKAIVSSTVGALNLLFIGLIRFNVSRYSLLDSQDCRYKVIIS